MPANLPQVNQDVTILVKGKLIEVEAKNADYNNFDSIRVRPSKVTVEGGKKG